MASKTLSDFNCSEKQALDTLKKILPEIEAIDLFYIFSIAIKDKSLFPNKTLGNDNDSLEDYLKKWSDGYLSFILPSNRPKTPKATCSDPAIKEMVKTVNALSEEEVEKESQIHDLFMAAENVQGNLLEEYIANKIRPFGWLWCYGETLRAVDFCTKDGHYLLQIKNKNNTENSSSSAIREGTAVHKWYRLGSKRINGVYEPDFKWEALNAIINDNKTENCDKMCNLTEDDYHSFLKDVLTKNPRIIKE